VLPQERGQIVARVGRQKPCLVDDAEEKRELLFLGTPFERECPHSVLEEAPGQAICLVGLAVYDLVFPHELGLQDPELDLVNLSPDGRTSGLDVLDGALIDRVVGQVHLEGAERLYHHRQQLGNWSRLETGGLNLRLRGHSRIPRLAAT
jgi:hypothetical protein